MLSLPSHFIYESIRLQLANFCIRKKYIFFSNFVLNLDHIWQHIIQCCIFIPWHLLAFEMNSQSSFNGIIFVLQKYRERRESTKIEIQTEFEFKIKLNWIEFYRKIPFHLTRYAVNLIIQMKYEIKLNLSWLIEMIDDIKLLHHIFESSWTKFWDSKRTFLYIYFFNSVVGKIFMENCIEREARY